MHHWRHEVDRDYVDYVDYFFGLYGFRNSIDVDTLETLDTVDSMSCPYQLCSHCSVETCDEDNAFEVSSKVTTFEDTKIVHSSTYIQGWTIPIEFEKPKEPKPVENVPFSGNVLDVSLHFREGFHSWQTFVQEARCKMKCAPLQDHDLSKIQK